VNFKIKFCLWFFLFFNVASSAFSAGTDYIIFGLNASKDLAGKIAKELNMPLGKAEVGRFNDGEISIKINENVRNKQVFIVQSTARQATSSINDNIMELYLFSRALKRASAANITAIIPYYGYGRQDRKISARAPISAADLATLIETAGVDRVVAIDLHAGQIQGFFQNIPVDNLYGSYLMAKYFAQKDLHNPVVVSPDAGGVVRAKKFRELLEKNGMKSGFAMLIKTRSAPGVVESATVIGDIKGRDIIIVDDICDTGGTLVKSAEELKNLGAKNIYASITHPVFSKDALAKIENSVFKEILVTDSIELSKKTPKVHQLSVAPLLSEVIQRIDSGDSISGVFRL
jgi:ribose-phosphate pyrophosphokinase